ncbi:MAG: nucleoside-diphosphate sugar epimerase/dehydratase [Rikenellaceae bacterium]
MTKIIRFAYKIRSLRILSRWIVLGADTLISAMCSFVVLFFIDTTVNTLTETMSVKYFVVSLISSVVLFFSLGIYKSVIRHFSIHEIVQIIIASIGKVLSLKVLSILGGWEVQPTIFNLLIIIDSLLTIFLLVGFRITLITAYNLVVAQINTTCRSVLIYGIGANSVALMDSLANSPQFRVAGFVNPERYLSRYRVANRRVYTFDSAEELYKHRQAHIIDGIIYPDYKSLQFESERLVAFAQTVNIKSYVLPSVDEIAEDGKPQVRIKEIQIEDLLGRDEIEINMKAITDSFAGKTIMVTGAAGSIGSELCRQLVSFGVKRLILFDNAETPLHNIRLELENKYPSLNFVPCIGDVRSADRLTMAFESYMPQVVFHAAAYKHVPLMEENPCEAVRVNVTGTHQVAEHCVKYGVEKMVMVSTDKAVNPTNVMGASKRLAEIYVQSLGVAIERGEMEGNTKFITTRFGNVLGSNGSVIPYFKKQIAEGGPVTVTHPEITRYFMTIPEACRLVMDAAAMSSGNEIYVFDMGTPMKIADLAKKMIRLAGFEPDVDIELKYTGLRPGEKLYEELLSNEENTIPTSHHKISVAKVREYSYKDVIGQFLELDELASSVQVIASVSLMKAMVPEFISKNSVYEKLDVKH